MRYQERGHLRAHHSVLTASHTLTPLPTLLSWTLANNGIGAVEGKRRKRERAENTRNQMSYITRCKRLYGEWESKGKQKGRKTRAAVERTRSRASFVCSLEKSQKRTQNGTAKKKAKMRPPSPPLARFVQNLCLAVLSTHTGRFLPVFLTFTFHTTRNIVCAAISNTFPRLSKCAL